MPAAEAQTAPTRARQSQSPFNLDLTSGSPAFAAPGTARLQSAAGSMSVKSGQMLTPAQYAALCQVLAGGAQSIKLDGAGRATAGTLSLSAFSAGTLSSLVIPAHVTVAAARAADRLVLTGELINSGTLLTIPLNGAPRFILDAGSIFNNTGGRISSFVPGGAALNSAPVSLTINSQANITNLGTICANGALSLNSGGSILNGAGAVVSGDRGLVIESSAGKIINQGLLCSSLGSVALSTTMSRELTINNSGGTILANGGKVFLQNLSSSARAGISLSGGLVSGDSVEFSVANGTVEALLDEIRGPVDISACDAHVAVSGGNLSLRSMNLEGDPSFVNSSGDITLFANDGGSTLAFPGQDLAVLASGDVIAGAGLSRISLSAPSGGGNLFIAAGLQVSPGTSGAVRVEPPTRPGGYRLGLASASGGSVNLPSVSIDTSAGGAGARAGAVTIIAHDNNKISELTYLSSDKGFVKVGAINASAPAGSGGDVTIIAQSDSLDLNRPVLTAGSLASGKVQFSTGEPVATGLLFINGSKQPGALLTCREDLLHDPVPISINGVFSGAACGAVSIEASGPVSLSAGTVINTTQGELSISSSCANVLIGDDCVLSTGKGDLTIAAEIDVDLGLRSKFASGAGLIVAAETGSISGSGNYLLSAGDLAIAAEKGNFTLGSAGGNFISAGKTIFLGAEGSIDLPNTNTIAAGEFVLAWSGNKITLGPGQVEAGKLSATAPAWPDLLGWSDIQSYGGIFLISKNDMNVGANLKCAGMDMMAAALKGNLNLASGTSYNADGGNIAFLAGKQITGDSNSFASRAAGQRDLFFGGVIELSSGFSFNPYLMSLGSVNNNPQQLVTLRSNVVHSAREIAQFVGTPDRPFTSPSLVGGIVADPSVMGSNVAIDNNFVDVGLVKPTTLGAGAAVNLSNSLLSLNKGAMFFDAIGKGAKVTLTNSRFSTVSYSVLSSDYTSDLPDLVASALSGGADWRNISLLLHDSLDFSNNNLNGTHLCQILASDSRKNDDGRGNDLFAVAHGLLFRRISGGSDFHGFDTGRTDIVHAGGVSLATRIFAGGAGFQPLSILNDPGGVTSPVRVAARHSDLVLFTTAGQVLTGDLGGSKNASLIGGRGTTVSSEPENLLLHGGKVYASSGKEPMQVRTIFGTVRLGPETSAAIAVEPDGGGRVVIIGSNRQAASTIKVGNHEDISLKTGDELVVRSENGDRALVLQENLPVARMIQAEGFFQNRSIRVSSNTSNAYQRMLSRLDGQAARESRRNDVFAALGGLTAGIFSRDCPLKAPCSVLAAPGTIYEQDSPGRLQVETGSLFLHPDSAQTVATSLGELEVGALARAEVQVDAVQVRFRAYSGPGRVSVFCAGKQIALAPGEELMLQREKPTREDALPRDGIARRGLTNFRISSRVYGVAGEFSIVSALQSADYLRPLRFPAEDRRQQIARDAVLKTASSLNIVRAAQGRFFLGTSAQSLLPALPPGANSLY